MVDVLVLASRLLLAAVLAVAAASKLADREGSRQAVVAFGVPERLAAGVALLLPIAELTAVVRPRRSGRPGRRARRDQRLGPVGPRRDGLAIAPSGAIAGARRPDRRTALLELPSLEGEPVSLADLSGHDTLLLFWNPDCDYCRGMHDDLRAWESTANGDTPRLVVVSSGEEEATRSDGFRSTVLLDEEFAAGRRLRR